MLSPTRLLIPALILALPAGGYAVASPGSESPREVASGAAVDKNPCLKRAQRRKLYCPDLQMSPPANMFLSRSRSGRLRLHAANSINSVGAGPAELRGRRNGRWTMKAEQTIYKRGGGRISLNTGARLGFKAIPGQYRYWKFRYAAEFELWRLDKQGRRIKLARRGPKVSYCLRDLEHRNPQLPNSPATFHYPACNQKFDTQRVTLGTSVGWSDVYPSTYHEQYLYVDKLKGCFAYVHYADPRNGIYESSERNNEAETIVKLPFKTSNPRGNCPRRSTTGQGGGGDDDSGGPDGGTEAP